MGNYAQKSQNIVGKLVLTKARLTYVKKTAHKNFLYSKMEKCWPVHTENKQNVQNKKMISSKNHRSFIKTNKFNNIRDTR